MAASVLSVQVAEPREIVWLGRTATTSIWKELVEGRVRVGEASLEGDRQADMRFHGGADKALYAYAREDYDWWEVELGHSLANATFGENLTLKGLDVTCALVGERWRVGSALLEVTGPRTPCWKLGARMESVEFPVYFAAAGRPGAYFRVLEQGDLSRRRRGRGRPPAEPPPDRRRGRGDLPRRPRQVRGAPAGARDRLGVARLGAGAPRRSASRAPRLS